MARQNVFTGTILPAQTLATSLSQKIDLKGYGDYVALQVNYANATTAGITFASTAVNTTTSVCTITATANLVTGALGQLTTTGGLPSGVTTSTNYWLIVLTPTTVQFASSLANAVAGTFISLSTQGTGNQTFTPTASSGNVIKAQASLDGTYFTDINTTNFPTTCPATVTVATTTSGVTWRLGDIGCRYLNIVYTPSVGTITFSVLMQTTSEIS